MSKKKTNTDDEYTLRTGDVFNETDEDTTWIVGELIPNESIPIAVCRHINMDPRGEDEEDRFDMRYVDKCVRYRRMFVEEGFADLDVYGIYKLSHEQLLRGLFLAKQNASVRQTKEELRRKMLFFRNILEVPSDVSDSGEETEEEEMPVLIDESKENGTEASAAASATAAAATTTNQDIGNNEYDGDSSDSSWSESEDESDTESEDEVAAFPGAKKKAGAGAKTRASSDNGEKKGTDTGPKKKPRKKRTNKAKKSGKVTGRKRKSLGTAKRKSKRGKKSADRKHQALWKKHKALVRAAVRAMPENAWREPRIPRNITEVIT